MEAARLRQTLYVGRSAPGQLPAIQRIPDRLSMIFNAGSLPGTETIPPTGLV
ncbi:hypothetical protein [Nitrosovibrio tenuis]|uniref:Uncharacterized protein n=1 Tax=Nitrosovibrio tenuis TaxID=1233 RepID=A0A1H7NM32_9PROT|nr:hypothetical protein [Nitrosovibrio tenuis]SEL24566.1 hypothetical protein SAMN05216387_10769 [Nitrosovibrio tenuis]